MIRHLSALALVTISAFALGCGKDSSAAPPATTSAAATAKAGDTKAAADKKKLPAKAAAKKDEGAGKKGGAGDAKPSASSHKAGNATVNASQKHKAEGPNPCDALPDGAAECHGDELLFCHEKELWALDCNAAMPAAHPDLFSAGTCYETPEITDCMGAGQAEDGVVDFCTSDLSTCCDTTGDCYLFH